MTTASTLVFGYFEASEKEMTGLLPGRRECSFCGKDERCFELQRALGKRTGAGCVDCLRQDRFGFFHITQVGYLDESGLTWYGSPPSQPQRSLVAGPAGVVITTPEPNGDDAASTQRGVPADSAIAELRRTPSFPSWNELQWRVHCADFMVYLGVWGPRDVVALASRLGLAPRACFVQLAGNEHGGLWTERDEWGIDFHVFRCSACSTFVGAADFS